ncbi:Zn(II)2Cys6 transcription factor [Aspergillus foveolatus]|uniref:Zn(II)2Cys6 transcription factor n=1 Tax=Aspergillus foveolatus TaxID=210207 RepID=UPI003CCDAE08
MMTRSCYRCSQKKIRCSKSCPCESCSKSGSKCVFPGPGRAPRRKLRPLKGELVSQAQSLTEKVQELTRQLRALTEARSDLPNAGAGPAHAERGEHGTLLVDEEATPRYVSHQVLVNLGAQVAEPKDLTASFLDNVASPRNEGDDSQHENSSDQFLFQYSSLAVPLSAFHPDKAQRLILWKRFEESVAPVVMIFHKPSLLQQIMTANCSTDSRGADPASEAVLFAVYFASVTSMDADRCAAELGQTHVSLLRHYRFVTEQALARANFLHTQSLPVLQATTLFLTCLRRPEDAPFVFAMTAAVHRIAQGLGLHRDGTRFGLSPFETETRRRLWWSIYLLDSRASEYRGIGAQITDGSYETRLPLNINDEDISPESTTPPEERTGFTGMTFCLVRCEMTVRYRRLHLQRNAQRDSSSKAGNEDTSQLSQHLHELNQIHIHLQERYLQFCDTSIPLQWVTATVARLALARLWLIAHVPESPTGIAAVEQQLLGSPSSDTEVADTVRERLFITAIEVVEFARLLETDPRTSQWSWLFECYPQWHSVVFLLTELCARPQMQTPLASRAWAVAREAVARWNSTDYQKRGVTPKVVLRLAERAAAALGRDW